jgi:hypothetical protein
MKAASLIAIAAGTIAGVVWLLNASSGDSPATDLKPFPTKTNGADSAPGLVADQGSEAQPMPKRDSMDLAVPAQDSRMAITASAPTLTFEGRLLEFIQTRAGAKPGVQSAPITSWTADKIHLRKDLNPEGKILQPAEAEALDSLLSDLRQRDEELVRQHHSLLQQALVGAVGRSHYLARGWPTGHDTSTADGKRALASQLAAQASERQEHQRILTERFGKVMRDWSYSNLSFSHSDGLSYACTVYFTPHHEPALFAWQQRYSELDGEMRRTVSRFFADLPK